MILSGINFSSKSTHVSIIHPETSEQVEVFIDGGGVKNTVYYKNSKLLTMNQILRENDITLANYIPNLHLILLKLYEDNKIIDNENTFLKLQRNSENGIEIILKDEEGKDYVYDFENVLTDFFWFLVQEIRQAAHNSFGILASTINCVISCSEQYNEDQVQALKQAAQNTGINHIKIISEIIASCLGNLNFDTFQFQKPSYFLLVNFNTYDLQMILVSYNENQFKILLSEKTTDVQSNDIDNTVFEMLLDSFQEQIPGETSFKDMIILESLAQSVKYHFAQEKVIEDDVSQLVKTYVTDNNLNEESENFWHAKFRDVDLFIDQEIFQDLICEPLAEKVKFSASKLKTKIENMQNIKVEKISLNGAISQVPILKAQLLKTFQGIKVEGISNINQSIMKGSLLWCEKIYSLNPSPKLKNFKDEDLSQNILHSIGIKVKIPNFSQSINKKIIQKGTFVPLQNPINLKLEIFPQEKELLIIEGETVLLMDTQKIMEIDLSPFFRDDKSIIIDVIVNLNEHYVLSVECQYKNLRIQKRQKYIPVKVNRRQSFSMINQNSDLKKFKLRAEIADKIFSFESYYDNLYSKIMKRKYQGMKQQLEKFKCFSQNDFFEIKKLENVLSQINAILDFQFNFVIFLFLIINAQINSLEKKLQ